jgi:hypothetical protein
VNDPMMAEALMITTGFIAIAMVLVASVLFLERQG